MSTGIKWSFFPADAPGEKYLVCNGDEMVQYNCTDGYKGRTGIFEMLPISEEMSLKIMGGATQRELAEQAETEKARCRN